MPEKAEITFGHDVGRRERQIRSDALGCVALSCVVLVFFELFFLDSNHIKFGVTDCCDFGLFCLPSIDLD